MIIKRYAPNPLLQQYISHYWTMQGNLGSQIIQSRDIPDGHIEIILNFGTEFQKVDLYGGVENYVSGGIKGQFDHAVMIGQTGEVNILGISFKPFGFYPFSSIDLEAITNIGVPIDVLMDSAIIDQIHNCIHSEEWINILDEYLISKFDDSYADHINLMEFVVKMGWKSNVLNIDELSKEANISVKHLERLFKKYIGLTPKRFLRVQRMRKVISAFSDSYHPNWFGLITALGFYDQPHFCREFKSIIGLSPTDYYKVKDPFSAHYQTHKHSDVDFIQ